MSDWTKEPWETCAFSDTKAEWGIHAPEHPDARKNDKEPPYHMEHAVTICRGMTGPAREANAERIIACVNACAGMADPAAEISRLRAALGEREKAMEKAKTLVDDVAMMECDIYGTVCRECQKQWATGKHEDGCPTGKLLAALSAPGGVGEEGTKAA